MNLIFPMRGFGDFSPAGPGSCILLTRDEDPVPVGSVDFWPAGTYNLFFSII